MGFQFTRIAVAHSNVLNLRAAEAVDVVDAGGSFIVSWGCCSLVDFDFQAELFPSGDIEIRWGEGRLVQDPWEATRAGIEKAGTNAYPVTSVAGTSSGGAFSSWPEFEGVRFTCESDDSATAAPSTTLAPTTRTCGGAIETRETSSNFEFVNQEEASEVILYLEDDHLVTVPLPKAVFPGGFPFFGASYAEIVVGTNGNINFGTGPYPSLDVALVDGSKYTRIAVAHADWDLRNDATERVYALTTASSIILSWEVNLSTFEGLFYASTDANFQAELFSSGDIEIRWGTGVSRFFDDDGLNAYYDDVLVNVSGVAGIESASTGDAYPVTTVDGFGGGGGAFMTWPQNQAVRFECTSSRPTLAPQFFSSPAEPTGTAEFKLRFNRADGLMSFVGGILQDCNEQFRDQDVPNPSAWHFFCVGYDGVDVWIHVDGALLGTYASPQLASGPYDDLVIGHIDGGTPTRTLLGWVGAIDDVLVFSTALTTTEIDGLYQLTVVGDAPRPCA
ncbi:hypothetical protein CTAYLR_004027 [Chrysophaeum taylorii]|uniref:Uncharacterized protein n=1 Tax=Chrysophaeum taylorii TaxID=2483200 RepID=A0AAD7XIP6_9STRA|nr:hypothetical protein CTAYLR_004027 [Chrysophaeum taylorii]